MVKFDIIKLEEHCDVLNGDRGVNYPSSSDFVNHGIPFINAGHIQDGVIAFNKMDYISIEHYEKMGGAKLQKDDILYCLRGSLGKYALYQLDIGALASSLAAIRCNKSLCKNFLFQVLGSDIINKQIFSENNGSSQPNLSASSLKNFKIPFPSISEQRRISAVLSDTDCYIATLEKLIAKKRAIKQGAMQELLTGKRRLPGFKGEWVEKRMNDIGYSYSGLTGKRKEHFGIGNAQYITFLNVLLNEVIDTTILENVYISENENQNSVQYGDLFFNTSSETPEEVGMCSVLLDDLENTYLNSFCFGFRLIDEDIDGLFLSYYFNSNYGRKIMTLLAQGATRYNLSKSYFNDIYIKIPSFSEQSAISDVLSDMDAEIESLNQKLIKAKAIKQGMMQNLLTGKIRLTKEKK